MSASLRTPPYSLPNIEAHPGDFLGPSIVSVFIQCLQTGYIVAQALQFSAHACREPRWICALVVFVCFMAIFQTATCFASLYDQFVNGFGNWIGVVNPQWSQRVQAIVTASMAAPVQAFLMWRCYHVLHRKWTYVAPLIALWLASIITSCILTAQVVPLDYTTPLLLPADDLAGVKIPCDPVVVLSQLFAVVLDVIVAAILLIFLLNARSGVFTKRLRRVLLRLIVVVWEAAVPPSACAIAWIVCYILLRNENFWNLVFQSILGKLYVISLLTTLCTRASLSLNSDNFQTHFPTITESDRVTAALPHSAGDAPTGLIFDNTVLNMHHAQTRSATSEAFVSLSAPQVSGPLQPDTPTKETYRNDEGAESAFDRV